MSDMAKDLALVMQEDEPLKIPYRKRGKGFRNIISERAAIQLNAFIGFYEIRPGEFPGIEVCSLYRLYKEWHAKWCPKRMLVTPQTFVKLLIRQGWRRTREFRLGRDSRPIGMTKVSAAAMKRWLRQNPDTDADRAPFRWRKRASTAPDQAAGEVTPDLSPDHREGPGQGLPHPVGHRNDHAGG